jgi:plasmid stabilization system protein ParE
MTRSVEISPSASRDIERVVAYYKDVASSKVATDFLVRIQDAMQRIEIFPFSGEVIHKQYRKMLIRSFPFALVYQVGDEAVTIIAVINLHQQPPTFDDLTIE